VDLIFVIVGGALVLGGLFAAFRTWRLRRRGVATQGTVADIVQSTDSEGATTYRPKVRFTTADGRTVEFTERVGSSRTKLRPGDAVPVLYDPARPERAKMHTAFRMWAVPVILIAVGLILALSSLLF